MDPNPILELPDFDTLRELYDNDPEALENLRRHHIDNIIENCTSSFQRRLRGIQFQIDNALNLKSNSISRCIYISQLMHDSFEKMLLTLNSVNDAELEDAINASKPKQDSAKIIQFPPPPDKS